MRSSTSRNSSTLGLILLDIDRFKQFNDLYGHPAGDRCLQGVANVLKAVCRRPRDLVARYGGEELAVILPDTNQEGAIRVAKDILQKLRDLHIPHADNLGRNVVTVSAGVYVSKVDAYASVTTLIQRADQALYAAKSHGRDCVFCFDVGPNAAVAV